MSHTPAPWIIVEHRRSVSLIHEDGSQDGVHVGEIEAMSKDDLDHILDLVNGKTEPVTRTPEDKARAVIANLQQLIAFEEAKIEKGQIESDYWESKKVIASYKSAVALIRSEFSLT